jgi:CRISPR-associated protein Csb2
MLTLGIRYLNGFVTASHGRHEAVEWPPHPARVFMALAATHFETGHDPAERAALKGLESFPDTPEVYAPEAQTRAVVTQYVPVNDTAGPAKAQIQSLPLTRDRKARVFARAWLKSDSAFLTWPKANPPPAERSALAGLCGKVTRIGHSSSLVQVWLTDSPPAAYGLVRWAPDEDTPDTMLRVARAGTLAELERVYAMADGQRRPRPVISTYSGYTRADVRASAPAMRGTVLSPALIAFALSRLDGPFRDLELASAPALSARWHEAVVSQCNGLSEEARAILSGHAPDGRPLESPHAALLPLGFVGHPHADGRLLGVAVALPAAARGALRAELLGAIGRVRDICLGRLGRWALEPAAISSAPATLRPSVWTAQPAGAVRWASVTPVAYDQHPKSRDKAAYLDEVARMVADGCERIGLPRPVEIAPTPVSAHLGAPPAHAFPRLRRKDGSERRHSHVILRFDVPVVGPVAIGAGRYRGYGFCRPLEDRE